MQEHQIDPGTFAVVEFLDSVDGGPVALRRMQPPASGAVITLSAGRWRVVDAPAVADPADDQVLMCHVVREA